MNKRKKKLQAEIGTFVKQYGRKAHAGHDPNDRSYDRGVEAKIKRMNPEELDELMHGSDSDDMVEEDIAKILLAFENSTATAVTAKLVRLTIDAGSANAIVLKALLKRPGAFGEILRQFERFAKLDQATACILMAHLWGQAGEQTGEHDVCDAIDLWIAACNAPELQKHLKRMAETERDADYRKHIETWIKPSSEAPH
jgi:hypothetical protein